MSPLEPHSADARRRDENVARLRRLIADSLEGGLLRYSRRQAILDEARRLGVSDFNAHVLIAQVQFGDASVSPASTGPVGNGRLSDGRAAARLAGAGLLAFALFMSAMLWL